MRDREKLIKAREAQKARPKAKRERRPRPLSNATINKTIRLLRTILKRAVKDGYIPRNPAEDCLLRESKPSRTYLQPAQVAALLAAAGELDAEAPEGDTGKRRPLLATLALAGLRIGEAVDLRWRDVNLAARKLRVVQAKTDAGVREVSLTPTLQELLAEYRTRSRSDEAGPEEAEPGPEELVFPTAGGKPDSPSNVRNRSLSKAVKRANEALLEAGGEPMNGVSPHSLRRTFISLLLAAGADVPMSWPRRATRTRRPPWAFTPR